MMHLSDISWWGVFLFVLLGIVLGLISVVDRRMLQRVLKSFIVMTMTLTIVGGCLWLLYRAGSWWFDAVWMILMSAGIAFTAAQKARIPCARFLLPLSAAVLVSVAVVAGSLLLLLSSGVFERAVLVVPLSALLYGHLFKAFPQALQTYVSGLRHTQAHYRYLLACGASHLEAVRPCVQRSVRAAVLTSVKPMTSPMFIVLPLLLCGLLLGGVSPVMAVVLTVFLLSASFVAAVLSVVFALLSVDRLLFDRQGLFLF